MERKVKDPDTVADWQFDFTDDLDNDTITGTPVITVPAGITHESGSMVVGDSTVDAWFSGGTAGNQYLVNCEISTTGGRTFQQSMIFLVTNG